MRTADTKCSRVFSEHEEILGKWEPYDYDLYVLTASCPEFVPSNPVENLTVPEPQPFGMNYSFIIENAYTGKNLSAHEVVNETGIYIYFDDPLPKFGDSVPVESYETNLYSLERNEANHLLISVANRSYALSCFDYNTISKNSMVCLAEEKRHVYLNVYGCDEQGWFNSSDSNYIFTSDGRYGLSGYGGSVDNYDYIAMCKILSSDACGYESKHRVGSNTYLPGGDIFHVWVYAPGYTLCASWAEVSLFTNEVVLENADGVVLDWNATTKNQRLKSIFIPANTSAFEEFVQN